VEHDAIDVVLPDVQMPRLDGASLARHLRRRQRPMPVALTSAAQATVDVPDVNVMAKPFDVDRLLGVVAAVHAPAHHSAPLPLAATW
jgi:CheY-like chemotaxis protein